jgi:TolB-like protein
VQGDFRVGTQLVQPQLNAVFRGGTSLHVEPKVMEVLVYLAEHSGEVLPKERVLRAVWADTFVTEDVLTRAVSELRKVFDDDSRRPHVLQTIPKSGYRLIAPVEWVNAKAAAQSLAVLPFVNANHNSHLEYLSEGITDCIIKLLSCLPQLRVVARSTVFRYKDAADPQAVGRDLNVEAVLTGKLVQRDATLTLSVELVDVAHGWQLWGEQYHRSIEEVVTLEQEIAREISDALRLRLTGDEVKRLTKHHTENTEAHHLYLHGRYLWNKRTEEALRRAVRYFEQAITKDARYALAYTGLADCYTLLSCQVDFGSLPPEEVCPKAEAAARKAIELDGMLGEAYASLGNILTSYHWDWPAAERALLRAIDLNPRYATAHHWYAELLSYLGRFDEAGREIEQAQKIDPLGLMVNTDAAQVHYFAHDYDRANLLLLRVLELEPNFLPARTLLGLSYQMAGQREAAYREYNAARHLFRCPGVAVRGEFGATEKCGEAIPVAMSGYVLALGEDGRMRDDVRELKKVLNRRYVPACCLAAFYIHLDRREDAFEWLQRACDERSSWLLHLAVDPVFDRLRSDSRFDALLSRVGLPARYELADSPKHSPNLPV